MSPRAKRTKPDRERPACPRCGYDLSGAIESWTDRCPLEGVCPECGLGFTWRDVFDPGADDLRWFVEHARGLRRVLFTAPATLVRVLLILPFWLRVEPHHRVRLLRAAVLVLGVSVAATVLAVAAGYAAQEVLFNSRFVSARSPGATRRLVECVKAIFFESDSWQRWSVRTPAELFDTLFIEETLSSGSPLAVAVRTRIFGWSVLALYPATLLFLPVSLRRAKVRPALVLRAACYSAAPVVLLALNALLHGLNDLARAVLYVQNGGSDDWPIDSVLFEWALPLGVLVPVWASLWWLAALTVGWRVRHGPLVWLLNSVIVFILAFAASCVLDPYFF